MCIKGAELLSLASVDYPPISQFGLKQTLNWILGSITHVNQLADERVRDPSARTLQDPTPGTKPHDGLPGSIKRRRNGDVDGVAKTREEVANLGSDAEASFQRRRGSSIIAPVGEEQAPARSHHDYLPAIHPSDSQVSRLSSMNPPPAPIRQLLSPPGRSFATPTTTGLNYPSSSAYSPAGNSQGVNLPALVNLKYETENHLPPLDAPQPPDSALREHAAALQHEVSLQMMALSSLQAEHNKLLSAYSRSQTRASTLEKKHCVSDNEIVDLTEEKMRLQSQVMDLERDVEELSRSRDETRRTAVQEGAQYVEIVDNASRLEKMRATEAKAWNQMKEEMERKIQALSAEARPEGGRGGTASTTTDHAIRVRREPGTETPALRTDPSRGWRNERAGEPRHDGPRTPYETIERLQDEIGRLRERWMQAEKALEEIRGHSLSMEGLVKAIQGRTDMTAFDRHDIGA
jgi:hypothetical protein